jgi:5-formyltetrahydrofolate cyclo-ligase
MQAIRPELDTVMSLSAKQGLRDEMRARRRALSAREQTTAGKALAAQLRGMPGLAGGQRVAAYLTNDGEIDPLPMMRVLIQRKRRCFLPIIVPLRRPLLRFGELKPNGRLKSNRFGILEPQVPPQLAFKIGQLDWIFVPLVAFDRTGNRLGMGGGFYDATLDVLRHRRHGQRPRLIGLAHEFQRVKSLNVDSWDVPLHGIVTDCGYYAC